ncbi:hypothetical protein EET67_09710 [Pseudaminobacter arsenicus]|uniref:Uncharacterized protein n=1 Tax=Borborobacter arsenicus TaxID=1851146 RepID=A0A432V6V3_9HYPH|nr:hypothetical protein [Pseudaminobacter arsenicus]RUM97885.1 hypothetical protein EET67_09710 [Pseudaminobacter arsenicus]
MTLFRIHFDQGEPIDIEAATPAAAQAAVQKQRPAGCIKKIKRVKGEGAMPAPAEEQPHPCPICAEPFKPDDLCASDVEMGICHAACLEGSPVVDLDTGEPVDGPATTYTYRSVEGQANG